jgi:hypothetical protein
MASRHVTGRRVQPQEYRGPATRAAHRFRKAGFPSRDRAHNAPTHLYQKRRLTLERTPGAILGPGGAMSDCCKAATAEPQRVFACPISGNRGKPVELQTVKALLTERALRRVGRSSHYFCPDPDCDVVYFDTAGSHYTKADVRIAVWQKEPFGQRTVCYCFGENEADIRAEMDRLGRSEAVERVRRHIQAWVQPDQQQQVSKTYGGRSRSATAVVAPRRIARVCAAADLQCHDARGEGGDERLRARVPSDDRLVYNVITPLAAAHGEQEVPAVRWAVWLVRHYPAGITARTG